MWPVVWLYSQKSSIYRLAITCESGEPIASHIHLIEKLHIKKARLLASLTFLLGCHDHNIITRFLQLHQHFHSRAASRIYQHTSFALLRERIHNNRWELDHTSRALLQEHLRLSNYMSVRLVPN